MGAESKAEHVSSDSSSVDVLAVYPWAGYSAFLLERRKDCVCWKIRKVWGVCGSHQLSFLGPRAPKRQPRKKFLLYVPSRGGVHFVCECAGVRVCTRVGGGGGCPVSCHVLFARRLRDTTVCTVRSDPLTCRFCTVT